MTAALFQADIAPRLPAPSRFVLVMGGLGILTGLISSLPSPLPDLRLSDPDLVVNTHDIPLHAGLAFGAMLAVICWLWIARDLGRCLLVLALGLVAWLAAVNTANEVATDLMQSDLFGTSTGAKEHRETIGWLIGGLAGGGVGAGLTAFGLGIPAFQFRRPRAWLPVVVTGALLGLLLYPAALYDFLPALFVPWQAGVAAAAAYGLSLPKA